MDSTKVISADTLKLKENYFHAIRTCDIFLLKGIMVTSKVNTWEFLDEKGNTGLIVACDIDNLEVVANILDITSKKIGNKADFEKWIDQKSDNGFNALHYASYRGNIKIIRLLVHHGCNVTLKNDNGLNVMHLASQGNQVSTLIYFNENHNFSYFTLDNGNSSPLHWSAYSGASQAFDFLVKQGGQLNDQDRDGFTPLHLAALSDKRDIIKRLVKLNAKLDILDHNKRTAIDICTSKGDEFTANYLKDKNSCFSRMVERGRKSYKFVFIFMFLVILNQIVNQFFIFSSK